ncbi:hypothetical protein [Streptosporangium lutulentum]|uniref:Uncharacterized protein n=1 Tax=Streptosporangium lutulentum TaxID=1461250 RepID=A0ABT9Q8I3_9ACTN|nr:hypothetical protein [Streptosporangium lutulentum]MDP9842706.1 hypothetical protein [Streptosporangium lutulentum]
MTRQFFSSTARLSGDPSRAVVSGAARWPLTRSTPEPSAAS